MLASAVFFDRPGPAIVGGIAMGLVALPFVVAALGRPRMSRGTPGRQSPGRIRLGAGGGRCGAQLVEPAAAAGASVGPGHDRPASVGAGAGARRGRAIGHCLTSLRAQVDVPELEILVLDDRSSDGTDAVVSHHLEDPRVHLTRGETEPPAGWLGKPWACHRLAEKATGQVLVFVDADVTLAPDAVARMVTLLAVGEPLTP